MLRHLVSNTAIARVRVADNTCSSGTSTTKQKPPISQIKNKQQLHNAFTNLDILDSDIRSVDGNIRENLIFLLNINDGGTRRGVARGTGIIKSHSAKVCKGNEAVAFFKVFDNPLSILLAKGISGSEVHGDGLASGQILNGCHTGRRRISHDSGLDSVTGTDVDAGEIVGIVRVPLVPGFQWMDGENQLGQINSGCPPSYVVPLPETVKSTPVWRIAF